MRQKDINKKILEDYKKQGDAIITEMLQVLTRAQRKVEDEKYREILKKLKI